MESHPKDTLINGRYQLLQLIGVGGLAHIYNGWDHVLRRNIAVKILRPDIDHEEEHYKIAWKEATMTATLQHPNIVTIYDFGESEQGTFLVMELLKGETLEAMIQRGLVPLDDFEQIARQLLQGLAVAHNIQIVHCDLKPSNIVVQTMEATSDLNVKVLDFGISKYQAELNAIAGSKTNSVLGSIYYMAPEMINNYQMDQRTDLYSLGHLLFHALAGRTAVVGEEVDDLVEAHRGGIILDLADMRPDIPTPLHEWIHFLMQTVPEDRPFSAASALELFSDVMANVWSEMAAHPWRTLPQVMDVQPSEKTPLKYNRHSRFIPGQA